MSEPQADPALSSRQRYLQALACKPVDRPPAWIMRQAGRYLPEYRELRERTEFLERVHDPGLATEVTMQPLRRFPLDAAIVFSDILIVLEAMGQKVEFPAGGPRLSPALGDMEGDALLAALSPVDAKVDFAFLAETLKRVRGEIGESRALLGFAGAPFTLACYALEGGGSKDFAATRRMMHSRPDEFAALLSKLGDAVTDLLLMELDAGADAVQLFDTWAGQLSAEDYARHVAPSVATIISRVQAAGGKVILFQRDGTHLLEQAIDSGANAVGLDWRVDIGKAARLAEGRCAIQGNLDPGLLFAPASEIRTRVRAIHDAVDGRTGHVFNLGHGILPSTPIAGVEAFLAAVGELGTSA